MEARSHNSPRTSPALPLPSHPPRPPAESLPFDFFTDPFSDQSKTEALYLPPNPNNPSNLNNQNNHNHPISIPASSATSVNKGSITSTHEHPIEPALVHPTQPPTQPSLTVAEFVSDNLSGFSTRPATRIDGVSPRPPLASCVEQIGQSGTVAPMSPAERRRIRMAMRRRRCPRRPSSRFSPAATPPSTPTYGARAISGNPSPASSVTSVPPPGTPPASLATSTHPLDKKSARVIRNREVALRARQAAKMKMKNLESENCSLKTRASSLENENMTLRTCVQRLMNGLPVSGLPLSTLMSIGEGHSSSTGTIESGRESHGRCEGVVGSVLGGGSNWGMEGGHSVQGDIGTASVPQ